MSDRKPDYRFGVLVYGEDGGGKTSLIDRYVDDTFSDKIEPSTCHEQTNATVEVDGKKVALHITNRAANVFVTETGGDIFSGVGGVLIVFDVTSQDSFNAVPDFERITEYNARRNGVQRILVGNKIDLKNKRQLDYATAKEYAEENNMDYMETSAKTPTNVKELFTTLARYMIEKKQKPKPKPEAKKQENSQQQQQQQQDLKQEKKSSNLCLIL